MLDDHIDQPSRRPEELIEDDLEERLDVDLESCRLELDAKGGESSLEIVGVFAQDLIGETELEEGVSTGGRG